MYTEDTRLFKAISIANLKKLLNQFPDDYLVTPNQVRELLILTPNEKSFGFIMISTEEFEKFD